MLERALTQPQQCSVDPLKNAQTWGIPIWATKKLQAWLEKIYESLRDSGNAKRNTEQSGNEKSLKVKHLKNSYIKFESFKRFALAPIKFRSNICRDETFLYNQFSIRF